MSAAPERALDVVTIGETMVAVRVADRIRFGGDATLAVAGAESNVAIGLARLGHGVRWGGRLGADESGELVLRTLRAENVFVDTVSRDTDRATGLVLFEQRLPDVTRVEYHRRDSAGSRVRAADSVAALTEMPRVLHITGVTPSLSASAAEAVTEAVRIARGGGALISFDVNFRSRLWDPDIAAATLRPLARAADVVIASEDELGLVARDPAELIGCGVSEVVIKLGADGATAHTAAGVTTGEGHRVSVVDSIGAGDAFTAGYLSALLDGGDIAERLARANTLGAFAVSSRGDWEGLPSRDELALITAGSGAALR
ncbi:sugar kinase [Nocardia carnea]|uniref:Sugar kinase n=1 Tax=Nocardia carnea TaxID=37328 RepID=A0ABW7TFF4_9NOCA|nr:sugar kinase [Nocardia carnea]